VTAGAQPWSVLPWDSEFFGMRVARIDGTVDAAQLAAGDGWCRRREVKVAYLQLPIDRSSTIRAAEQLGFSFVDVRVVLAGVARRRAPGLIGETRYNLRDQQHSDIPSLENIAASAYRDSRFYADGGFARERCDALYAAWIRRSCDEPESSVLVVERNGVIAGYVAYQCDDSAQRAKIDLIAVGQGHQGVGIGAALVGAALDACSAAGAGEVEVATQARNIAAQRLYQRAGMQTRSVSVWLHKWFS
jgi:ribosomal protein S18 acetylase RimI-like enzyme